MDVAAKDEQQPFYYMVDNSTREMSLRKNVYSHLLLTF